MINSASREEIANFLRISDEQAERVVFHRETVGPIVELDMVNRIVPEVQVDDVVDLIDLADGDPMVPPSAPIGHARPARAELDVSDVAVTEMTISAEGFGELYPAFATVVAARDELPISIPAAFRDGEYVVPFPEIYFDRDVKLVVREPDGKVAVEKSAKGRNLGRLTVKLPKLPKPPATINAVIRNPAVRFPATCIGQLINATGSKLDLSAHELVFFGLPNEAGADHIGMRPIAVVRPKRDGRFDFPFPKQLFVRAKARLAHPEADEMIVALEKDGRFPERLNLVLTVAPPPKVESGTDVTGSTPSTDIPSGATKEKDCGCDEETDSSGFAAAARESEGGAGDSLAGTDCPKFRANNVVVNEQEYTLAVRLDQPVVEPLILRQPEDLADEFIANIRETIAPQQQMMMMRMISEEGGSEPAGRASILSVDHEKLIASVAMVEKKAIAAVYKKGHFWSYYGKKAEKQGDLSTKDKLRRDLSIASRPPLSKDFQLDWDDEPTTAQAVTAARGHLLRIKQEWVTDGYSLGALLHTTPLAPGQAKRIAIVDWTRSEAGERDEDVAQSERLSAELERNRSVSEAINGVVTQFNAGASAAGTAGKGVAGGLAGPVGPALGFIGAVSGIGVSGAGSVQYGNRKIGANTLQNVSDATRQSAGSVRQRNASTVVVTDQDEVAGATTEVIANYNHCHSLNIHHFEVLRHFLVRTRLADVQECVFVPLKMSDFTPDKILRWREEIRQILPFRERRGLDALERLDEYWPDVEPEELGRSRADAEVDRIELTLSIEARLVRPRTTQELIRTALETEPRRENEDNDNFVERVSNGVKSLGKAAWDFLTAAPVPNKIKNTLLNDDLNSRDADRAFAEAFPYLIRDVLNNKLAVTAMNEAGRRVALGTPDVTILGTPRNNRSFRIKVRIRPSGITRRSLASLKIECPDSARFFPEYSNLLLRSATVMVRADDRRRRLFSGRVDDDISDAGGNADFALIDLPLSRWELENLFERDLKRARRLFVYLNRELEQFHRQIWLRMDKARRYMLLDGVRAPKSEKSIAQVTDNELIGVVGNMLVLPVGRGSSLFPELEGEDTSGVAEPIDLLAAYAPTTPVDPIRVSLPTGGVHAEAVMGDCNSCEKIDNSRYWKWEQHPIPLMPDAISGDMLASRSQSLDLNASGFDPALIGMQTPEGLPDPTGLGPMLEAIVKSDSFRDAAGLSQTQQAALAAYTQGVQGAQAMANKAQELLLPGADGISPVQQRYVSTNMQAIADQIDRLDLPDDIKNSLKKRMVETVVGKADTPEKKEKEEKKPDPTPEPDPKKKEEPSPKKPKKRSPDPDAGIYFIELDPRTFLFLNFAVGSDDLHPDHMSGLRFIAQRMSDHTTLESMTGHASRSGTDNDNLALSKRRANELFDAMTKVGPKRLVRPQIVDAVGEGKPTVRSQFGDDGRVSRITGETHRNDPVERSVVVRLKDDLPPKPLPEKIDNDGDTLWYFGPFLWLGDMFSNNRFFIDGGDVFYGDEKIEGDRHITRNDGTKVEINIDGPLFEIGDITFNISGDTFTDPKKKDEDEGPSGGSAAKTGNQWVMKFSTPDISKATSVFDVIDKIIEVVGKAAGSNAVSNVLFEEFKELLQDTVLPAIRQVGDAAMGVIEVPAKVWLRDHPSDEISGRFSGRGFAIVSGQNQPGAPIPVLSASGGFSVDSMGRLVYTTAGDPFGIAEWERFSQVETLDLVGFSAIDDLQNLLSALERLASLLPTSFATTPAVQALSKMIDEIRKVIGLRDGELRFDARVSPDDALGKAQVKSADILSVFVLTNKGISFKKS
ncbi:OmpA family protein [Erythrobacter rubeus]|uniref:OmpA family protein n=1 Tax=Erythrobacter rubeus TaxID=2760803 RepID=A0ABR8KVU3_9SPHN|nr:OmpA family protein [Erythrobacter rubeus]MBD2843515.1 hypothetical protein [Erythrobacter rubeus]